MTQTAFDLWSAVLGLGAGFGTMAVIWAFVSATKFERDMKKAEARRKDEMVTKACRDVDWIRTQLGRK